MTYYAYVEKRFNRKSITLIDTANAIINEYINQGFVLTVRQLYYQLVARDYIPNTLKEYKRVAAIFNDARLAGLMSWDAIEDRTREFLTRSRWKSGKDILYGSAKQYHMDMWANQDSRVFLIVEKEALVGVFEPICREYDIPLLAARGYPSVSVVREFVVTDMLPAIYAEQEVTILHFGDHDPSGIDMSRDLQDRFNMFLEGYAGTYSFERCALNMDQVRKLRPPENPAKTTDARFEGYLKRFGSSSWELDALSPEYLADLVRQHVTPLIEETAWAKQKENIDKVKTKLRKIADTFKP